MKHILIGTAGHVDHGKTALIRALTGIETDRLQEEKSRGITIDLGFAHMPLAGGEQASIVDVPGHEKFIKNMLAGAGGIDLVLLVIAADDGVMPQTREHLSILQLLQAKDGIITLTKCDLVDQEWQDLISEDIKTAVKDTFLQNAPIIHVSSHTGQGIDQLKQVIQEKIENTSAKNIALPFRIPVDRVFSAEGFGTVITGTLIEGHLNQGDEVTIYPKGNTARIRTLQVHGRHVETAFAGQRVAVNLSGLRKEDIERGHILAKGGTIQPTRILDIKLAATKGTPREITTGSRLHFHYGTHTTICKLTLIGTEKLTPGQEAYAQLRFPEEIALKNGDSFIVRFYSPMETVGGGTVLNTAPKRYKPTRAKETIESLKSLEKGDLPTQIQQAIINQGGIATLEELKKRFPTPTWESEIETLTTQNHISIIGNQAIDENTRETLFLKITNLLKTYHKANPLHQGIGKSELRSQVLPAQKTAFFDKLLQLYNLHIQDGKVALPNHKITYTPEQQKIRDAIINLLQQSPYTPPSIEDLHTTNKKLAPVVLDALLAQGEIISTEPGIVFLAESTRQARDILIKLSQENNGTVTLAQFRDATQTSRKFALSLLEYFDRIGFTRKIGDAREILRLD
ncbi:MAG: selenocysteine-specific translation elongation factor [Defluviitaleaceae bacterium]|nr:selenocysteine-specific translation elongation factor [Defluviitaleaceae bacterium]